eukprot:5078933-Prymnesium_polylepis.1
MPSWVCVRNKPLVRGVVLCFVPGMGTATQQAMFAATLAEGGGAWTSPRAVKFPRASREGLATAVANELL